MAIFVINWGEDGLDISKFTEEEFEKRLSWNKEERCIGLRCWNGCDRFTTFEELTGRLEGVEGICVVIKGEEIIPKPIEVVKEYTIEGVK